MLVGNHCSSNLYLLAAKLDEGTSDGITPLMYSCRYGRLSTMILLLNYGADVLRRDVNGSTALNYAISYRKPRVVAALLEWLKVDTSSSSSSSSSSSITPPTSSSPTTSVVSKKLELLLQSKTNVGNNVLHEACNAGNVDTLQLLLVHDFIDINLVNGDGHVPLHFASDNDSTNCTQILLQRGANVSVRDSQGLSPFHLSCIYKNKPIAMLLVQTGGVDPNQPPISTAATTSSSSSNSSNNNNDSIPSTPTLFSLSDHFDDKFIHLMIEAYESSKIN